MSFRVSPRLSITAITAIAAVGCGKVDGSVQTTGPTPAQHDPIRAIEVEDVSHRGVSGPDTAPRLEIVARTESGAALRLPERYVHAVAFREGVAAVTPERELVVIHADATRSILAHALDGLPTRAEDGTLFYAARFGEVTEIHALAPSGVDRRIASLRGSATLLSPQPNGDVAFVGAATGGVQGVWIADADGARCITNCTLRAGRPWLGAFRPPPAAASTLRVVGALVEWETADGTRHSAPLEESH